MKKNSITIRSSAAEYLTYIAAIGTDKETIEVRYEHENIQLIQKINYHIKKIYNDNELKEESTIRKFRTVQKKEK